MKIGFINPNRRGIQERSVPPVPPIGLEYLVDDLDSRHSVDLLDLCFVKLSDRKDAISDFVQDKDLIGITFRNFGIDSYWMPEEQFFVPDLILIVNIVKSITSAPIVLGGQGFSIYPNKILSLTGADFGVFGPGEISFRNLIDNIGKYARGSILRNSANIDILHKRQLLDHRKYIAHGGSVAIQTKIGCPLECAFCVEAKLPVQCRNMQAVIDEVEILLSYGKSFMFIADAEFNAHLEHASDFCTQILERGLKFSWSAYMSPKPMTENLVKQIKLTGCVTPCVSITSGDDMLLKSLDCRFTVADIRRLAEWFHKYELPFTVDVILGVPGDTLDLTRKTIALMEDIQPVVVGMNFGIRLYSNTMLGQRFLGGAFDIHHKVYGNLENNDDLFYPIFYISDLRIGDFLKEICDSNRKYRLLGYSGFEGVNYTVADEIYVDERN